MLTYGQALTPSEIQSLREDLKQSVMQAREIIAGITARRSAEANKATPK